MKVKTIAISGAWIVAVVMFGFFAYTIYEDATKPAPDPFAKCIPLPSSDVANYWRCEK